MPDDRTGSGRFDDFRTGAEGEVISSNRGTYLAPGYRTNFRLLLNTAYSYLLSFKCAVCLTSLGGGSAISCEG